MNKTELVGQLKVAYKSSEDNAKKTLEATMEVIIDALQREGEVVLPGIGKLVTETVPEKTYNGFGKTVTKAAHKRVKLVVSDGFKKAINE
jgi:nucleoid DNA-binding protein|nr:MAG TPA: Bacterial DNA-binding protein [Caudoviricetes sp.]